MQSRGTYDATNVPTSGDAAAAHIALASTHNPGSHTEGLQSAAWEVKEADEW